MPDQILPLTEHHVPSVLGLDDNEKIVVGAVARDLGLAGRTNTYHFKTELGKSQDEAQYQARVTKAGKNIPGKPKPYWIRNPNSGTTQTFTPMEAAQFYLGNLIPSADEHTDTLIVGEPTLDRTWRENYRKNVKQILKNLGYSEPTFFPEPFAVYQYYRHVEKLIGRSEDQQTVLIGDFGGGTFDCCVVQTTRTGELARSGANSRPLGVQSCAVAGEAVDIELLKVIMDRAKKKGVRFKDDPIDRARQSAQSLWVVENAKIELSNIIHDFDINDDRSLRGASRSVRLPAGSFHTDEDIDATITGVDLRNITRSLWHKHWGKALVRCHQESSQKLATEISHYDFVLIAGGSAQLPFLDALVEKTLPTVLEKAEIVVGRYSGGAVASGIAVECREQAAKSPELVNDRLVSCLLNDLYLRVGRRKDEHLQPKVKHSDSVSTNSVGLVYRSPGILNEEKIHCSLELRYAPKGVLHYWFHDSESANDDELNIATTSVRIPGAHAWDRKVDLELDISPDGMVTPTFTFKKTGRKKEVRVGQPFNLASGTVEGQVYLGIDFGTCNSYVSRFISPEKSIEQAAYPTYEISRESSARLLELENRCRSLRENGALATPNILELAERNELDFVFHSNKIEGNKLTRGQTEGTLASTMTNLRTKDHLEVRNLAAAYDWILENHEGAISQLAGFVRQINKQLLSDIESNAGAYRTQDVTIGGVDYDPPPAGSVDAYMSQLSDEIRQSKGKTSGLELAVRAHTILVAIHPFVDGNGRTARLLAASILLAHDLPVVVLNSDDKERYLDALSRSNAGSLDALMDLFAELLEESIAELEQTQSQSIPHDSGDEAVVSSAVEPALPPSIDKPPSQIRSPIRSVGDAESAERLATLLKKKGIERKESQKATYPAWAAAFEMFRSEMKALASSLDESDEFRSAGFELKFNQYDIVNEDRFEGFWTRRDLSRTWFCSLEITNGIESSGVMFQFVRSSDGMKKASSSCAPVSCALAIGGQFDGTWRPLRDEPIALREVGYFDGRLHFLDYDGHEISSDIPITFENLIADLLSM